ncbi:MAG: flagellar basal-body rod protein FlgG [Bacilli bacterium]|nr:flagellar basal-body rod protein FlgG [Bacilli bacterium]
MRALWTSASGLQAQQVQLDLLASNLANVNTTGYKGQQASFQELLQGQFSTLNLTAQENGLLPRTGAPDLRLANGVRNVNATNDFSQGVITATGQPFDMAIQGDGFFQLMRPEDVGQPANAQQPLFTRDGHFQLDANGSLVNDSGYHVVDQVTGQPIVIDPQALSGASMKIDGQGNILLDKGGQVQNVGAINYVLFRPTADANLASVGNQMFALKASNQPATSRYVGAYFVTDPLEKSKIGTINQGSLETSNVDVGKAFTDMIQVQRAYQLNSRAIQTTDQMMGMANNMKA